MAKEELKDQMKLTDWLALERTKLANQRTLLAMLRTGLYFIVMGVTVLNVKELGKLQEYFWVFFIVGGIFILSGVFLFLRMRKKLEDHIRQSI